MSSHAYHLHVSAPRARPAVPLRLLPQPWRDWVGDTERATGAPADYVLQSVLLASPRCAAPG